VAHRLQKDPKRELVRGTPAATIMPYTSCHTQPQSRSRLLPQLLSHLLSQLLSQIFSHLFLQLLPQLLWHLWDKSSTPLENYCTR